MTPHNSTVESVFNFSINTRFGNLSTDNKNRLHQIVKVAFKVIDVTLPSAVRKKRAISEARVSSSCRLHRLYGDASADDQFSQPSDDDNLVLSMDDWACVINGTVTDEHCCL